MYMQVLSSHEYYVILFVIQVWYNSTVILFQLKEICKHVRSQGRAFELSFTIGEIRMAMMVQKDFDVL